MERLQLYRELLLSWNRKVNLIGPEAVRNLDDHISEAIEAAGLLQLTGEVLDFGSGGGLPAIPMAIVAPEAHFHLVEADSRKWAFLKHAARECAIDCEIYGARLDEVLPKLPAELRFRFITSRAVGYPEQWLPTLVPHLEPAARAALFQSGASSGVPGFRVAASHQLSRGMSNFLVVYEMFHVEHDD
jgi:16S rRNA (guanine527-N7)-methyltransferase